jgi:hypothetical protein
VVGSEDLAAVIRAAAELQVVGKLWKINSRNLSIV